MRFDSAPIAPQPKASLPPLPSGEILKLQAPGLAIGLGGRLWPSSAAMCRWLRREDLLGQSILEVGCGCGAVGIYAAALGAGHVLLTDGGGDELLQVAAGNVGRNHRLLNMSRVEVVPYQWGVRDLTLPPRVDLVLGADVTYYRQSHRDLCRSIRWLIDERSPRVVLAHEHRYLTPAARRALGGSSSDSNGDDGLVHFCEAASASGLQVATVHTESEDGTVTAPAAGAEWTDHLLVRGEAISLLEVSVSS
jgi:SAM-dependent methyltransferase